MSRTLVKLGDYYVEWSSIADAPATAGMTLDELEAYVALRYGNDGLERLLAPLMRVGRRGHSAIDDSRSVREYVAFNRAGPGGCCLTFEELCHLVTDARKSSVR